MKHIGWCLKEIQRIMGYIPHQLQSEKDKEHALRALQETQDCLDTLKRLITHPSFAAKLQALRHAPYKELRLQAQHIEALNKDLEDIIRIITGDIAALKHIITHEPARWADKVQDLVLIIHQKFAGEKTELRKEFDAVLHSEDELKALVKVEKHLAEFLR